MIKPIVAGQFYAATFSELNKQIEECFNSKFGPGALPLKRKEKEILGVIVPHAGYMFSGPCAAWAYKEIAESRFAERYIILGPDHNGICSNLTTSLEDWETPFGIVKCDKSFIIELLEKCEDIKKGVIMEHSIEVQLPFLQYVCKDRLKDLKIVPIVVPRRYNFKKIAERIVEIDKDVCIIISSDFTHYGPQYLYTPFTIDVKNKMYKLDGGAIELIKKLDPDRFLEYVDRKRATICGANPIAFGMEIINLLGVKRCELLRYYTSGDIIGDYTNAVGYAAMKFS